MRIWILKLPSSVCDNGLGLKMLTPSVVYAMQLDIFKQRHDGVPYLVGGCALCCKDKINLPECMKIELFQVGQK